MATLYIYNAYTSHLLEARLRYFTQTAFSRSCHGIGTARYISPSSFDIAVVIAVLISCVRELEEFIEIFAILTTFEILNVRFEPVEKRSSLELSKLFDFKELSNVWRIYRSSFRNFKAFHSANLYQNFKVF